MMEIEEDSRVMITAGPPASRANRAGSIAPRSRFRPYRIN
jgi:hypothetical protein